jgi:hypothetical protein
MSCWCSATEVCRLLQALDLWRHCSRRVPLTNLVSLRRLHDLGHRSESLQAYILEEEVGKATQSLMWLAWRAVR